MTTRLAQFMFRAKNVRGGLLRAPPNARVDQVFVTAYHPYPDDNPTPPASLPPLPACTRTAIPLTVPLIYHVLVPCGVSAPCTLQSLLATHLPIEPGYLRDLTDFGAVYARIAHPGPSVSPKPPRIALGSPATHPTGSSAGDDTVSERTDEGLFQIVPVDTPVYARVHANPRRHRSLWPVRILYNDHAHVNVHNEREILDEGGIVVVDKPAGIPTVPAIDNMRESLLIQAAEALQQTQGGRAGDTARTDLRVTSRLDVGTSGAVILARTASAAMRVNTLVKEGLIDKRYRVLTAERPREGTLVHWSRRKADLGRGQLSESLIEPWSEAPPDGDNIDGGDSQDMGAGSTWRRAELVVERVDAVDGVPAWESSVRLITGRTHQIRQQFAAEGWPVWADSKYANVGGEGAIRAGGTLGDNAELHGLHAESLEFPWNGRRLRIDASEPWWRTHDPDWGPR